MCLRAPHDLSFLAEWGEVFRVFDDQDSGNLCFGVDGPNGRLFVKYAGAPTVRYEGSLDDAVARLRGAQRVYEELRHSQLIALRHAGEFGAGFALGFDWTDAEPLGLRRGS